MRNLLIALCLVIIGPSIAFAQKKPKAIEKDEYLVFQKVEIVVGPENPAAWTAHLAKHSKLPDSVAKTIPAGTYIVTVTFIIDQYGTITDAKADNDPGYGLAARAAKTINGYKGKWTPENQCGRNVKSYRKQAITYVIAD